MTKLSLLSNHAKYPKDLAYDLVFMLPLFTTANIILLSNLKKLVIEILLNFPLVKIVFINL